MTYKNFKKEPPKPMVWVELRNYEGKTTIGRIEGNWVVYKNPQDVDISFMMGEPKEWRPTLTIGK